MAVCRGSVRRGVCPAWIAVAKLLRLEQRRAREVTPAPDPITSNTGGGSLAMQRITQTVRACNCFEGFELQGRAVTANLRAAGCDPNLERTYGTNTTLSTSPTSTWQQRDRSRPAFAHTWWLQRYPAVFKPPFPRQDDRSEIFSSSA